QPNSQRANVRDFGKFTINVADGWTAVDNQGTAVITKNDNSAQLTISVADAGGATKAQLAEAFVAEFKKTFAEVGTPVADEDGDYSWEMKTTNGAVSEAYLSADGSDFMLFVVTNRQAAPDDISAMLGSIKDK
ncbi:MAG: hypothetical protein IJL18_00475, partial [Synergistaceae bacterium]|nr:hypothetical protein [Synergistaceae bacterium]